MLPVQPDARIVAVVFGSDVESWSAGQQTQMWMERGCLMHLTVAFAVVATVVVAFAVVATVAVAFVAVAFVVVVFAVVVSDVVACAVVAGFVVADVARCLMNAVNAVLIAAMVAVFVHSCSI